jgi:two-component system chemotaxis sensor kinase CheA
MSSLDASHPALAESLKDLLAEGPEHLEVIERELLSSLNAGACDGLSLFRAFHTLKGIFGFLGFEALAELTHRAESRLEPYKLPGSGAPEAALCEGLLAVADRVRDQMDLLAEHLGGGSIPLVEGDDLMRAEDAAAPSSSAAALASPEASVRKDLALRVSVAKLDALMDAVGELSVAQSQLDAGLAAGRDLQWLSAQSQRLSAVAKRLQDATLRLRMVPVEPVFLRVSRQAHELSRRLGKSLRVEMEGGGTEIDRGVAEALAEPLIHLIRNALDHGLESAEQRAAAGKAEEGRVRLCAAHQGGEFVLTLEDDGRGLDPDKLRQRGLQRGLLQAGEATDEARLFDLIFEPGFSTAEAVTDLSGRGVGLEAVRQRVQSLKGQVEVQSRLGHGCRFVLRLPLTLALMDAIVVRAGEQRYLLPAAQVRRFIDGARTEAHSAADGGEWVEAGGSLGLLDLRQGKGRGVLLHVEHGGREAGLMVDEVLGKQQAVAKSLGGLLKHAGPYTGGAVLGDGGVGLILDLDALLQRSRGALTLTARS